MVPNGFIQRKHIHIESYTCRYKNFPTTTTTSFLLTPKKTKAFGSFYFNQKARKCPWIFFGQMHFTSQMKKVWELGGAFKVFSIFLNRITSWDWGGKEKKTSQNHQSCPLLVRLILYEFFLGTFSCEEGDRWSKAKNYVKKEILAKQNC